jgi:hypothetical protein
MGASLLFVEDWMMQTNPVKKAKASNNNHLAEHWNDWTWTWTAVVVVVVASDSPPPSTCLPLQYDSST